MEIQHLFLLIDIFINDNPKVSLAQKAIKKQNLFIIKIN